MGALAGREQECRRLEELLARARAGMSGALVLRGEPGSGKTALLDEVQAKARGFDVVRFDAVESETELGFAAVHDLLRGQLDRLDALPGPYADALRTAFGIQEREAPPDRFRVGLAVLELVSGRAAEQPLLVLVDDAQWLDHESSDVLGFVARRLHADAVAVVVAVRDTATTADLLRGLPQLEVRGLGADAAGALLRQVAGVDIRAEVVDRVVAETGGSPLALVEVARELTAAQRAGTEPLPDPAPSGFALEPLYAREIRSLPPRTQLVLLAAAADGSGDPTLLWRAGARLGFTPDDAVPAEDRGLVTIRNVFRFRHPLIRSAVYYGAPLARRQSVHAALALASGELGDADRRVRHLASAAAAPDDAIAAELELAADAARARGSWENASSLLARSAALSVEAPLVASRLLAAADAACTAGEPGRAQVLLDEAATHPGDRRRLGQVHRVQARIHRLLRQPAAATSALLAAARQLGTLDVRLSRDILLEATVQAQISDRLAPPGATRGDIARLARLLPLPSTLPPTVGDALLDADTDLQLAGLVAAAPALRRGIDAARAAGSDATELFQWLAAGCAHATILADNVALHELAWRLDAEARRQAAASPRALALSHTGLSELVAGLLSESERCFDQLSAIAEASGRQEHIGTLLIAAWRGDAGLTRRLLDDVTREATAQGQGYQLTFAGYARLILALGLGRYREAYLGLGEAVGDVSPVKFALAHTVEAAVRCGERASAERLVATLAELAAAHPVPRTCGDLARARALLAQDDQQAENLHREAIALHEQTRGPAHQARSHQLYGEWLRRAHQTTRARHHLRVAHDLFTGMRAQAFADRTAAELAAAGDPVDRRTGRENAAQLTPQEARVAHLAAGGATNTEIAAQLYLSVNTVDYHLRKVYRKLGVTSRRALRNRVDEPPGHSVYSR